MSKISLDDALFILKRTEHFIAMYESGEKKSDDVAYEIYNGFRMCGIIPQKHGRRKK